LERVEGLAAGRSVFRGVEGEVAYGGIERSKVVVLVVRQVKAPGPFRLGVGDHPSLFHLVHNGLEEAFVPACPHAATTSLALVPGVEEREYQTQRATHNSAENRLVCRRLDVVDAEEGVVGPLGWDKQASGATPVLDDAVPELREVVVNKLGCDASSVDDKC
jgi:hypothetical protein